nr:hypothetical protein [Tanacetum cinerariifolium]
EGDSMAGDNYKEAPVFDDDQYEEEIVSEFVEKGFVENYLNFQEDENNVSFLVVVLGVEEESMPVYDTDIEDVIEEEEGFIPFPPLPLILSPPSPILAPAPPLIPIRSLSYRAVMIRLKDEAASTSPPSSHLPSASCREDRPEVTLPPRKRLDIALGPRYEVGESSSAAAARPAGGFRANYGFVATVDKEIMRDPEREVGYGITDSWDEIVETLQGAPVSTDTELGGYVREFETRVRQDMYEIYTRLDDEQTERQLLISEIRELQAADRRRQTMISELLRIDHRRSTETSESRTALQG